ncbi:MAG: DUF1223 domain-containing protein [Elusimicrobia bacterium]|nr:DUF1223 domain-containing protein [Elusimicrobiota bacterium]
MRLLALLLAAALPAVPAAANPVLVELFTSQGCSSCPAADRLLSTWGKRGFELGVSLPLSFDVDYWNYLGWRDVFSSPGWSARQQAYSTALRARTYTPQMVVGGRAAFVGTNAAVAENAVELYHREAYPAAVRVRVSPSTRVHLTVDVTAEAPLAGEPHVMLALFENGLVTRVERGENGGRTLRSDFVVRRLRDLGPLGPRGFHRKVEDPWDRRWDARRAGAAVFVQDLRTMRVLGASSAFPLRPDRL